MSRAEIRGNGRSGMIVGKGGRKVVQDHLRMDPKRSTMSEGLDYMTRMG